MLLNVTRKLYWKKTLHKYKIPSIDNKVIILRLFQFVKVWFLDEQDDTFNQNSNTSYLFTAS